MIELTLYRARIGLFRPRSGLQTKTKTKTASQTRNAVIGIALLVILLLSGDVEQNPGPVYGT